METTSFLKLVSLNAIVKLPHPQTNSGARCYMRSALTHFRAARPQLIAFQSAYAAGRVDRDSTRQSIACFNRESTSSAMVIRVASPSPSRTMTAFFRLIVKNVQK